MAYASGYRKSTTTDRIAGDRTTATRDAALTLWDDRPALVLGTWRCPPPMDKRHRARLIWWKRGVGPGMGDLTLPWGTSHEEVYVLGNGWDRKQSRVLRGPSVLVTDAGRGGAGGQEILLGHPTPKPLDLMETLIKACPPGVIGDPFAGSGASLVAARNLGRSAIGVELEERHCETIARRLSQDCLDLGDADSR